MEIDGAEIVQHDIFGLLHGAGASVGDGDYAVLHSDFEFAGVGCGVAIEDIGDEMMPRAFTVDCDVHELEVLEIVAIERESLP